MASHSTTTPTLPDQYTRLLTGALLCLTDHYTRALHSGVIAYHLNSHNLLNPTATNNTTGRRPLDFGSIFITESLYLHPNRLTWDHGELHVKMDINFGDGSFSMEEKIRGSAPDVVAWGRDFREKVEVWCEDGGGDGEPGCRTGYGSVPGFFRLTERKVEIEESTSQVGETREGF